MENRVRETSVSCISYLTDVKEGDVSDSQDVQRKFCSDHAFINGIGVTVLTGDYLPPIILGEIPCGKGLKQTYIVDAMQRTSALMQIRFYNYRFTKSIEDSVIEYQRKKKDANGKICKDGQGHVIWETASFDIKNKRFSDFPEELQKRFDIYQLRIVTHQNCTMEMISKLIRRYNNHKAMNTAQKAFTYLDKFAAKVRMIADGRFFKDTMKYSDSSSNNGVYEKLVSESVMTVFHLDKWKKIAKDMNEFLNKNSSDEEFELIEEYLNRIEAVCRNQYQDIFTQKNVAVWIACFHEFTKFGLPDKEFLRFLNEFKNRFHCIQIEEFDNESFDLVDSNKGSKDKKTIITKISMLLYFMKSFFKCEDDDIDVLAFVRENVDSGISEDDLSDYYSMLDVYDIDKKSKLLDWQNEPSLISLIAYSFINDIDLDEWIKDYFKRNQNYILNQLENYIHMKNDLSEYLQLQDKVAV